MSSLSRNTPGPWGYRCRKCGNIAFAFVGEHQPMGGLLDDYEISQRGPKASVSLRSLSCQHCTTPVAPPNWMIQDSCVVEIDVYAEVLEKLKNGRRSKGHRGYVHIDRAAMGCAIEEDEEEMEAVHDDEISEEVDPLLDKSSKELRRMASDMGLRVPKNTNKPNIVALIRTRQEAELGEQEAAPVGEPEI